MPYDEAIFQVIAVANRFTDPSIPLLLSALGWELAITPIGQC
jgi:hypothetical protein